MASRLSLRTGKSLWAGYRLVGLRGEGSFGQVWEAEGRAGDRVAMKFMRCGSDLAAAQEVRNILSVRQLDCPGLVRIDRVWADRGYLVVVMELADGSLQDLLAMCRRDYASPVPPDYACHYLSQAAEALDFLNARRHRVNGNLVAMQHCDIKPSNILLFGDKVKLSDFGLSTPMSSCYMAHRRAGTLAYAAPEVHEAQLSQWTDQYALAVSYCELRGGRRPFPEPPARFPDNYTPPDPSLGMLSESERPIIARALSRSPSARWKSCGEMMSHLMRLVQA